MSYFINKLRPICIGIGILLILSAAVWLIFWQISAYRNTALLQSYVDILYEHIPQAQDAVPESRTDNTMPSLNVKDENFVGVIEFPRNAAALPVGAVWSTDHRYPCRYDGSVYDGTLIIGAANQRGQFDFVKEISVGNLLSVTDMTGSRFSYKVSDIRYSDHADQEVLYHDAADLTIFVKNIYALEYIMIYCTAAGS